jgi:hypothetical protein
MIYSWLFLLACYQLFFQYRNAHPSAYLTPGQKAEEVMSLHGYPSLDQTATFVFMISLTYISYLASRFSDWVRYRCRLDFQDRIHGIGSCFSYMYYFVSH